MVSNNKITITKGVLLAVSIIIIVVISSLVIESVIDSTQLQCPLVAEPGNETFLVDTTKTFDGDIITITATVYNDTWLDFNGVDNSVETQLYNTLSFWYKNTTIDWTFIVNSSGVLYVNGSAATPELYPIFNNGTNIIMGKFNDTAFFNGSLDDFRGYASAIDSDLVNLIYLDGRY